MTNVIGVIVAGLLATGCAAEVGTAGDGDPEPPTSISAERTSAEGGGQAGQPRPSDPVAEPLPSPWTPAGPGSDTRAKATRASGALPGD
jgi:hypothetical protein